MTKIFEALELVDRQRAAERAEAAAATQVDPVVAPQVQEEKPVVQEAAPPRKLEVTLEETLTALYDTIVSLLPGPKGKTVQFIAVHAGAGASTLIREFAKVCALKLNKSVLLLDADRHSAAQVREFRLDESSGWDPVNDSGQNIESSLHSIDDSGLSVSQLITRQSYKPLLLETSRFKNELNRLKDSFDLILVDSPPAAEYPEGLTLASKVDGIVLVVEAEKTRWQVLNSVSNRIRLGGGNILGAILNKRRHHVPAAIYKRL